MVSQRSSLFCAWPNLFLKLVLEDQPSVSYFKNHSWSIARTPLHIRRRGRLLPTTDFLLFPRPLVALKIILLQSTFSFQAICSTYSVLSLREPCQDLFSLFTTRKTNHRPPPPQPFFLGRYSLATLLLECKQHFIANIFLVFLSLLALSSTPQSIVPALQRTTSTAQAFMPLIWLPPFNLELHSFVTLLIYPAFFLPFILVLIVWSCWNFHTICSPHLQLHCVGHLVGRFHCCQVSFLFSFPRQLTCLAQTTFWCILITSLPLFDAMNNRWSMCLMSSASLYSAFTCLKTRVSEKKNSKANIVSPDVNLPKLHCTLLLITEILFLFTPTISRFTNKAPYQRPSYNLYKPLISFSAFFGSSSAQFNLQAIDLFLRFPIIQLLLIY